MKEKSDCIVVGGLTVYKPHSKTSRKNGVTQVTVGEAPPDNPPIHYVVILVGATGAGKSTLVNTIGNYLFGVQWNDDFRFMLNTEEGSESRGHSKTQNITAYTIHKQEKSPFPHCLTIIDTPGFGDAEGLPRDKHLAAEIKDFLTTASPDRANYIHAIAFVTQASSARLSPTDRYIFDTLLTVFGQSIVTNILLLTTFADGKAPPVLEAAGKAGIKYRKSFKFNNAALFPMESYNMQRDALRLDQMFWEMSNNSCSKFLDELRRMEVCRLQERLKAQNQMKAILEGLKTQVLVMGIKLEQLEHEEKLLEYIRGSQSPDGKEFYWLVEAPTMIQIDVIGQGYATNCRVCQFSCYSSSPFPDESTVCTICPKKCAKSHHQRDGHTLLPDVVKVVTTYGNLKKRYELGTDIDDSDQVDLLITSVKREKAAFYKQFFRVLWDAQRNIQELNKTFGGENSFNVLEDMDLLIQEGTTAAPAYLNYKKHLPAIRQEANFITEIEEEGSFCSKAQEVAHKLAKTPDVPQGCTSVSNRQWWLEWY